MRKTNMWLQKAFTFTKKNWFIFFAVATYIFFTFYYMGPAFTKCTDSIYGFGDSTAGPIWRESIKPEQPLMGGYETATNYPYGESLYSPVGYAALMQTVAMDAAAKVVGPVCSYNLYNIFGYLTTSLVMFGFVLYLLRNRWIALLAGYAVAFTPYVQSKVGGHPNYGYAAVLIGLLWVFLHLITYRKVVHAVIFGMLLAACAYIDPYFTLLAITLIVPSVVVWGVLSRRLIVKSLRDGSGSWKGVLQWAKPFLIAAGVFLLIISPLVVVRIKESSLINSSVGGVRGNVVAAAMQCSNKPLDYILPDPRNLHLVQIFGNDYTAGNISLRRWCGFGESRVSISIALLLAIGTAIGIFLAKRNKRQSKVRYVYHYDKRLVIWSLIGIGVCAFAIGLPPYIHGFITPSGLVLKVTEMWRIFAREYLVLNISVVLLAAIALKYISISDVIKSKKAIAAGIVAIVFLGVFTEYQINDPFSPPTFSYSRDIPSIYHQIRDDKNIQALVEYPIDRTGIEHDSIVYYLTMQAVHQKQILNSAALVDTHEKMHIALKDITDPQTIPVLRTLGVRYAVVHGEDISDITRKIPGVRVLGGNEPVVYALTMVRQDDNRHMYLIKLPDGPKAPSMLVIERGYAINLSLMQSPLNVEFESLQDTQLKVMALSANPPKTSNKQCFDVKMAAPSDVAALQVLVNGATKYEGVLNGNYSHIEVDARDGDMIRLHNSKGYNMRINNLGCR